MSNKCGGQNKRGGQRFSLNLTKRGQIKCGGQNFLLFDVREQLLIRKKKAFLIFKIAHVTKMSYNDLFLN